MTKKEAENFPIPSWIPPDSWKGFVEMRTAMGKRVPFTERAAVITINNLEKLMKQGQEPGAVLDQSTQRGWRGVFAITEERSHVSRKKSIIDAIRDSERAPSFD